MKLDSAAWIRIWTIGLALAALSAGFLIASVNPLSISLVFLALLLAVAVAGVLTNFWGGLAASALATLAIVMVNQYVGIYPSQNSVVNISSELAVFLLSGLIAGGIATRIDQTQRQMNEWLVLAEKRATHDEAFSTLRPEWSKTRLEDEVMRAGRYSRPLALALLRLKPLDAHPADSRNDRIAALQALIRICRSASAVGTVVAHAGGDRVMMILPEHTRDQAQALLAQIQTRAAQEVFFPNNEKGLGKPLREWGTVRTGLAVFSSESSDALLEKASAMLEAHSNV
jgi:GGDEF domain-containing protein